ncbi:A/G-specific adenine glycosylase [Parabacteroides sp. PFB2-12]|nr:A/G-specific adenine glycosylase [Parabacteroides sp. PM6-13]MDH6389158.1 A/G-specific adenine glycosylase [Parabacteroides sp. PFB2-12]
MVPNSQKKNPILPQKKELTFSNLFINWYFKHKRELPWRETRDPYTIWISEIILQQTRVAQGIDYFRRFMERFPDVASLAAAEEDEVLKYWQGLGYYSRARNLHAAAREIMSRHQGRFPSTHKEVLALKGIGDYTAAAILSFAWNQPYPVVDGNVYRVLSRLFGISTPIDSSQGKKEFTALAAEIMPSDQAGLHNQAIMEFGALQCTPQQPDCSACPFAGRCVAWQEQNPQAYPVKAGKTKSRNRYFHYFHILYRETTWLHRREGKDIWKGLYEFPLIETDMPMDFAELQQTDAFHHLFAEAGQLSIAIDRPVEKHILSHQVIYATFYRIEIEQPAPAFEAFTEISIHDIERFAIPRLIHIYLEKNL